MAQCPSCSKNLSIEDSHYGTLYTCPNCQSVFFVGWDGQPEKADSEPEGLQSASTESAAQAPTAMDFITPTVSSEPQAADFLSSEPLQISNEPQSSQQSQILSEPLVTPEQAYDFQTPLSESLGASTAKENFSEVVEFANADEDKGLVTYNLTIQGIDLSSLYQQISDALTDAKFNWQVEEIMARIKDGALVLESLTPAMTVVLVQRLKYLPVEIQWRQNVLTN